MLWYFLFHYIFLFNWKRAGFVTWIDFTAYWWVTTCNLRKSVLKCLMSETISWRMISLQLDPCSSNIQVTTGLNAYTIIHVWVWENLFPCLRSSELLMTTIFSATKKSLQLLQTSLSDESVSCEQISQGITNFTVCHTLP